MKTTLSTLAIALLLTGCAVTPPPDTIPEDHLSAEYGVAEVYSVTTRAEAQAIADKVCNGKHAFEIPESREYQIKLNKEHRESPYTARLPASRPGFSFVCDELRAEKERLNFGHKESAKRIAEIQNQRSEEYAALLREQFEAHKREGKRRGYSSYNYYNTVTEEATLYTFTRTEYCIITQGPTGGDTVCNDY